MNLMTLIIKLINYCSLFDEEFYYEFKHSIQVLPGNYKLDDLKKIIHQTFNNNFVSNLFVCAENTEPFIFNSLKLNDSDNIFINELGKIILITKSKTYILSNQLIIKTIQLTENYIFNKFIRKNKLKKLSEYEKIIYNYHPHRSNLSRYPLLILSRL